MYAATGGPNMKWGADILNGGRTPLAPPLATTLAVSFALSRNIASSITPKIKRQAKNCTDSLYSLPKHT